MSFLATCRCEGDACTCNDLTTGDPIHAKANKDSSSMNTKFDNKTLDSIKASAPSLPLHDLKVLSAALAAELKAREAQNSAKAQRIARAAQADPQMVPTITYCSARLRSLGLDIDSLAASADLHALDKAMTEANWKPDQRIGMKSALSRIGVLD
jgi:hypothetical protein